MSASCYMLVVCTVGISKLLLALVPKMHRENRDFRWVTLGGRGDRVLRVAQMEITFVWFAS